MRSVPDWSIQVVWWASGIFATGAAWYFLSTNKDALAGVSAAVAVLLAGVAVFLHRKKDALAAAIVPNELKHDLPDDYIRRETSSEAQVRLVRYLPELKAVVHRSSTEGWASPVTLDMREASYDMLDFLQFAWLKLAEFYPRKNFGDTHAQDYIESYVRTRFAFHWAKYEPGGPGSGGTIVGVLTGGDVIQDLETLIQDTMQSLFFDNQFLDLDDWLKRWKAADGDA
jgi:hypothetical protein